MDNRYRYILFDGDDTLWETQPLYKSTIDEFYSILETQGFLKTEYRPAFESINQQVVKEENNPNARLGLAMSETYDFLCKNTNRVSSSNILSDLNQLSQRINFDKPKVIAGVYEALEFLSKEFSLIFYSGGALDTQTARLKSLKLESYFNNRLYIVPVKDEVSLQTILSDLSIKPSEACMVGNSPRFDVNPAIKMGVEAIWLFTSFWRGDLENITTAIFPAFSMHEVINIITQGNGWGKDEAVTSEEARKFHSELGLLEDKEQVWVIGSSPKLDINPATLCGCNTIWIPTHFDSIDIEPFFNKTLVSLDTKNARRILESKPNHPNLIIRKHRRNGDLGGRLIVD